MLLIAWLAFASRLPRRTRLVGVALALGALALVPAFFRIRGVTGDLRPIVEPRFGRAAALPEPAPPPPAANAPRPPFRPPRRPASSPRSRRHRAAAAAAGSAAPSPVADVPVAPDLPAFPQFLGPTRDAVLSGPRLARDWTKRPPRRLWRQPLGQGWSGFAIAGGIAVTQEQRGDEERVVAYDAGSGRPLWSHADRARYETVIAGVGPRATPTIDGRRVYAMGATGILNALDLASGKRLWSRDVVRETDAVIPELGPELLAASR